MSTGKWQAIRENRKIDRDILDSNDAYEIWQELKRADGFDVDVADSVFAYFPDEAYAEKVLDKMIKKAGKAVLVSEVFDSETRSDCMQHRRSQIENYDERYEGLDKLFLSRSFFKRVAAEHGLRIRFTDVINPMYWNSRFMFNCFLYY